MSETKLKAIVYIDGLNLYRQKLEYHPDVKWLDVVKMCELMLPTHEIILVRYFTSEVKPGILDPAGLKRQRAYIRALKTLQPKLSMHFGKMRSDPRRYPIVPQTLDEFGNLVLVKVRKTEEKGTDVSLAAHMILDAAQKRADLYVLMSSDSDYEPPLLILRDELQCKFALFSPIEKPSTSLMNTRPLFTKIVRRSFLENSQFPDRLNDGDGVFEKPDTWVKKQDPLTK